MKRIFFKYWPFILAAIAIAIPVFIQWQEIKLKRHIYSEAISGNRVAIRLLKHDRRAWELHEATVREAIAGNENAQEILGIKEKKQ